MHLKTIGVLVTLMGILLPIVGVPLPSLLTIVIADATPPSLYYPNPPGDQSNPTPLAIGETINLRITVEETGSGLVSAPTCAIRGDSYSKDLILGIQKTYGDLEEYGSNWVIPDLEGVTLSFTFSATDNAGHIAERMTWGIIQGFPPEGYFEINGQIVDETSIVYVKTLELTFKFTAIEEGHKIEQVRVQVYSDSLMLRDLTLYEATTDTVWQGTYTLPQEGTYTVKGDFKSGGRWYYKMSLLVTTEIGGLGFPSLAELFNIVTMLGLALTFVGYFKKKEA